ncbi:MAG: sigma-70 family RNA polymerase sigma factor [Ilumatobacter sp.]|uniref:RNA polymerase sigma factor n=1 Tax=Ilumatobacter sp. TaxID=1967498 RepID=UPI003C71EF2C
MPLTGAAAARLYDDHVDAVHALITRRVGPAASADIVAETFEHALRSWDRFDQDRGTERLFLFGAAVAVLRSHSAAEREFLRTLGVRNDLTSSITVDPLVGRQRTRSPRVVTHAANEDLLGGSDPIVAPTGSALMVAIADLSPDDRDIVLLSLWESCPQAAIAETLDLSVGAVRSALGRIRRELKTATTTAKGRP